MALIRMDNVGIVFEDMKAAIVFFEALGLTLDGEGTVEGNWVDKCVGLAGVRCDIAMMTTPDGHSKLELMQFQRPTAIRGEIKNPPANMLGIRRLMFAVDDIDDTLKKLCALGAEVVDEVVQYEQAYRLCYLRGPEGILLALAQPL